MECELVSQKRDMLFLFFLNITGGRSELAIKAKNLEKSFDGKKVLNDISFSVKKGEVFGYLGPNGAGKTTTVRILTGLIKPDRGEVFVCGRNVSKEPVKVREKIGILPEVSNVYPDLTAWQNLMLASQLYGLEKKVAEKRGERLLKEFGIYGVKNSKVKTFSKGMKQKLMFCMVLISEPEVIFLDEPTSGLDVASARMLREKILEMKDLGTTVFLTSHNMSEVDVLCDKVAIIKGGKIIAKDTPDGIKELVGGSVAVEVKFENGFGNGVELSKLRGKKAGDRYVIYTTDPNETICQIVEFAKKKRVRIISINTRSPSLEDAFLKILGEIV